MLDKDVRCVRGKDASEGSVHSFAPSSYALFWWIISMLNLLADALLPPKTQHRNSYRWIILPSNSDVHKEKRKGRNDGIGEHLLPVYRQQDCPWHARNLLPHILHLENSCEVLVVFGCGAFFQFPSMGDQTNPVSFFAPTLWRKRTHTVTQ